MWLAVSLVPTAKTGNIPDRSWSVSFGPQVKSKKAWNILAAFANVQVAAVCNLRLQVIEIFEVISYHSLSSAALVKSVALF